MQSETKISDGYQTVVPSQIRRFYGLEAGDILVWEEKEGEIVVKIRKKRDLKELSGLISAKANSVELKKKVQRGEKKE